ncbi:hypothetical protein AGMMS50212_06450 [Spirochaetia bacterium]|nr:hypothetical protein AGMMS50212_06300 [Spirochaetia bacterium]GHV83305.1 hypothetical protein AGMMS50212_06450 [Spirochaetia bacterium]
MKKIVLFACVLCAAILVSCASSPPGSNQKQYTAATQQKQTGLPEWYLETPDENGIIFGVGQSKLQNQKLAMQAAESAARRSIADYLSTEVKAMLIDYARVAGQQNNPASIQLTEDVSKVLTDAKLNGSKIIKRAQGDDGTWYALASITEANAKPPLIVTCAEALMVNPKNVAQKIAAFKNFLFCIIDFLLNSFFTR